MSYASLPNTYEDFVKAFHPKSGLDLKFYKQNQMQRRILSFMNSHGHPAYPEFLKALGADSVMYDAFFKHLTINVSQFFRDAPQWKTLRETIIPLLLLQNKTPLKLWSAGCSGGQEPYSLAMTMMDYFSTAKFTVLGSDIDVNILKQAKDGLYKQNDFASTPPDVLQKYFTPLDNGYQIKDPVKRQVSFQHQNLLTDRFQSGYDFIACRNVVIYFTDEAKEILYKKFTDSLRPGGILFTGSTEHLFGMSQLGFKSISSFFYQKQ